MIYKKKELSKIIEDIEHDYFSQDVMHNLDYFKTLSTNSKDCTEQKARHKISCFLPWNNISTTSEGFIDCCEINLDREIKFPEYSLKEIWESSYYKKLRECFSQGMLLEKCAQCCLEEDNHNIRRILQNTYGHKDL